jgi:hypothetical protein
MLTILCCPSIVRCSLRYTISATSLKSSKSALFWVKRGYFIKCGIITLIISLIEFTENCTVPFVLLITIFPTPKNDCISFNNARSFWWTWIEYTTVTHQPVLQVTCLDSPTVNAFCVRKPCYIVRIKIVFSS